MNRCPSPPRPGLALALAGLALALLPGPGRAAEKVSRLPIVDRAIAHHGGERYSRTETALTLSSRSGSFDLVVRRHGGAYDYTVRRRGEGGEQVVRVTNDRVERWRDGQAVPVPEEEAQRWRDFAFARVYFPFLPYGLNDPSVYKEDLGPEEWDGRKLHKVKVTFAPGSSTEADDQYLYWFDPETGRVELFAYSFDGNPGGLRFRRAVNHRRVGGILFFDQENLGVDQDGLTVDQITPAFVAERMQPISTVTLENIDVRDIE